jgi:lipopolysaccharide/colanic/teichoic acid biosynthesis glycosyltransferase
MGIKINMLKKDLIIKRLFDLTFSFFGLVVLSPLLVIIWLVAFLDTKSNGFYFQKRIGYRGKVFNLIKFKTMRVTSENTTNITIEGDSRITKSGSFFRKTKVDELPQLWNILIGQMSFVGPRPDVPGYADRLNGDDSIVLDVKPGITGPAQLIYRKEEKILAKQKNPVKYSDNIIWPHKVEINIRYVKNYSFLRDLYYIYKTFVGGNVKH